MTQTRVFVTYVPAAWEAGAGVRPQSAPLAPVGVVLAGALLASGAVHSVAGADMARPTHSAVKLTAAGHNGLEQRRSEPQPAFAMATITPPLPPAPAATVPPSALPKRAEPLRAPKRDLAGFLTEQGLSLTPASQPAEGAKAAAGTLEAVPAPAVDETGGAASLAGASSAPAATPASPAETQGVAPGTAEMIGQTFPTVSVGGAELGAVTMRGGKVHLASLVGLLELKMAAAEFARLKSAPAADSFVDLDTLRAAGVAVALDPAGERMTLATA